ncbi:MAG: TonB-dependent receptor [Tannerella sp.]|jgi:outer membrane cobalamin receptor|nr:TonB-dependent receptor [Tannerella sp.]
MIVFCAVSAQNIELRGRVTERSSGEPLPSAVVKINSPALSTVTDNQGYYTLKLKQSGVYQVSASYIGYAEKTVKVEIKQSQTLDFKLENNVQLDEVVITSTAPDEKVKSITMGVERLSALEIKQMPALMGEVDLLKAIQLLPGVQATSEGGSGFSVRGGSPDQNLILIDNTTVYNASHLMGFFSVFNNDVLSGLDLYKGDFPVRYGGRLSSLLDVRTKDSQPEKTSAVGGIGLISSRLTMEGPIGEKTSWLVGGRRSYADLFLKLSSNESLRNSAVYFYDMNGKMTHRFSNRDIIDFNGYYGLDNFNSEIGVFRYGNAAASMTWKHTYKDNLLSRISLNYSRYDYSLESALEGMEATWKSSITDYQFRADMTHQISDLWNLTYGATSMFHVFEPGHALMPEVVDYKIANTGSFEHGLYLSNEQKFSDVFSVKYGVRMSMFQNIGKATVYTYQNGTPVDSVTHAAGKIYNTYVALEPRAGFVWRLGESSSIKGNYVHNVQFMQLANNSASGTPLDLWFPASPNIKPQTVDMFSVGYFRNFQDNMYETSFETYYKNNRNLIDFAEHANLMLNKYLEGEVRMGNGRAYGAELMVRKTKGTLNGFVNYTLSRSERTVPDVNNGKTYLSPFDKTHSINAVANYELSKRITLSAIWVYATGNPTTYPSGRFEIEGNYYPLYSGRNEFRRPDYHRLDLSFTYIPRLNPSRKWSGEWNLSLYNVYNKKNPWMITLSEDHDTGLPYSEMIYLFGIVPSISYNFKF